MDARVKPAHDEESMFQSGRSLLQSRRPRRWCERLHWLAAQELWQHWGNGINRAQRDRATRHRRDHGESEIRI